MGFQGRNKWIVGGVVITITILLMSLLSLQDYTVYFYTPQEAVAKASTLQNQNIKVGGMVMPGSIAWNAQNLDLSFAISDPTGVIMKIKHIGTPPDMFKENQGVVVEGKILEDGHSFLAKTLMVKHSEEYKVPDQKESIDKQLLEKSLFK